MASTRRIATELTIAVHGWRLTARAQRCQTPSFCSAAGRSFQIRPLLIRGPSRPSIAGSSVMPANIAIRTTIAAVYPSAVTIGMPATSRESSAMITVEPANTTAPPAVAVARAADSVGSMPLAIWFRCWVTMKRP